MIDAKQLRIGNLLFDNGKGVENPRVITVDGKYIQIFSIGKNTSFVKEHSYIPLKKEHLMAFGFSEFDNGRYYVYKKGELIVIYDYNYGKDFKFYYATWDYNPGIEESEYTERKELEFVHQLQNLCFDLTDQELVYTETETFPHWIRELYRADRHILEGRSYLAFRKDASHEAFSTPMEYHVDYWEELTKEHFYTYLESGQYKLDYNDEGDIFYKLRP